MLIDTHAHLNFKAFKKDLDDVIKRAQKVGVEKIIIPGAKIHSSSEAITISQKYSGCYAAVGIHPHHVEEFKQLGRVTVEEKLTELIKGKKVVAIGEIGLDYHEYKGYPLTSQQTKKQQKELLMLQIDLAQKANLPIIFHCRDAHDDQLELITHYLQSTSKKITGVFHCFDGEREHLKKILFLGFYLGFDGNISYPGNKRLQDLVEYTPTDKLLLETDAPFLTPIPFRGQRCEPAYLVHTASFISKIKKIPVEELAKITAANALKLFRF